MVMMKQLKVGTEASDDRLERLVQPEGFSPTRLKVLVVDDDLLCLMILERMLCQCKYTVTTCNNATKALAMLRENRSYFDLVITDVYMPDMDGFKLLEAIGLELDLPVIMMSGDGETDVVMKGITHGACDYIIKPVRLEELRNIWQHVVRKRVTPRNIPKEESSGEWDDTPKSQETESEQTSRKRKENADEENQFVDDVNNLKKARVVWSPELHKQFVTAVNQLGVDKAVPRRILEIMNVQGLTRENVASHLQKYRLYLKRLIGVTPQPYPVASFQACEGGNYGGIMQVQPGGRGLASSSNKGLSLGTVSMTGLGRGPAPQMDAVTLNTLMQLQNLQQQQQQQHQQQQQQQQQQQHSAPLVHLSSSLVPPTLATPLGLQRMDSFDLDLLMKAQYDVSRQRSGSTTNFAASLNSSQESLYADNLGDQEDLKPFVGLIDTMTGSEPMTAMSMSNLRPREDVAGKSLNVARNYGPSKLSGDFLPTSPFSLSNAAGSNTGASRNNFISYNDHPIGPSFLPGSAPDFLGQLHTYDQLDGDFNQLQGPHSKP